MKYENILQAEFCERLNRFAARVRIGGQLETVHLKNTGRLEVRQVIEKGVNA